MYIEVGLVHRGRTFTWGYQSQTEVEHRGMTCTQRWVAYTEVQVAHVGTSHIQG